MSEALIPPEETKHLEGETYLDYAGAGVYSQSQVAAYAASLVEGGFGNPHSINQQGRKSRETLEALRSRLLQHLNASPEEYSVVFTSGATGGLRLVAECFDWGPHSTFGVHQHSHNSVLGIRGTACGPAAYKCYPRHEFPPSQGPPADAEHPSLLAAPLVCNFSGVVVDLEWCGAARALGWHTLVDAAAAFGKKSIDLSRPCCQPDFLIVSFYKAFGLPTGLGALVCRTSSTEAVLRKKYFGGGTLDAISASTCWQSFKPELHHRLEDGTPSYLDAAAAIAGFDFLETRLGGAAAVETRLAHLVSHLVTALKGLRHHTGAPLCVLYGRDAPASSIVALNLLDPHGNPVGYHAVTEAAAVHRIHIRGGCFCNPGACHTFLGISLEEAKKHREDGHVCGDDMDVINGKPTGALRVSLGPYTTQGDLERFASFLTDCFLITSPPQPPAAAPSASGVLSTLCLYPIKGARPLMLLGSWPVTRNGFLFDRCWCLLRGSSAIPLTRKTLPKMGDLQPFLDLQRGVLMLAYQGHSDVLEVGLWDEGEAGVEVSVRGRRRGVVRGCEGTESWFERVVGEEGVRLCAHPGKGSDSNLSNTDAFLIVNAASVSEVSKHCGKNIDPLVFRPNLIVSDAGRAWDEDRWSGIEAGGVALERLEPCVRCGQVNIDPRTHLPVLDSEPLKTLLRVRGSRGKALFGVTATCNAPETPAASEVAEAAPPADADPRVHLANGTQPAFFLPGYPHLSPGTSCTFAYLRS